MRSLSFCFLVVGASLLSPSVARAETKERLVIDRVRIGFPGAKNDDTSRYKTGSWAPVYVDLTIGPQDIAADEAELVVETTDSDDVLNEYRQPLPFLAKGSVVSGLTDSRLTTYVRPGNGGSDITVSVRIGGRTIKTVKADKESDDVVSADGVLYVVLGAKLPGLRRALTPKPANQAQPGGEPADDDLEDTRQRRFADVQQVKQLPTRWFGYQAVDVIILPSGTEVFIEELSKDRSRSEALTEWVRRGGRILIAAGRNQQFVQELLRKMKLLHCDIPGKEVVKLGLGPTHLIAQLFGAQTLAPVGAPLGSIAQVLVASKVATLDAFALKPGLVGLAQWLGQQQPLRSPDGVEIAKLVPGAGVDVPASEGGLGKPARPLVVESACGLGHVLLVAFDIDAAPFIGWAGQTAFWTRVQKMLEPPLPKPSDPNRLRFGIDDRQELASLMQDSLESFGEITVISFGWVALLILLYIIVVGPLDYLFLKKVVKRLEWTWVTFPAVVLVVSALAYFTAYWLKGNDLKINKIDIVDIDLNPPLDEKDPRPQVYGSTWFTLFSPRIQNYTVGIEPAEPDWGAAGGGKADQHAPLVGWMGRPENVYGGTGRSGSQSLFRRSYEYTEGASALVGVPIQVWATKSFYARWELPGPPPFNADLRHAPADSRVLIGTITNNLPVELQDVVLLHMNKYYELHRLPPGVPQRIDALGVGTGLAGANEWLKQPFADPSPPAQGRSNSKSRGVGDFASLYLKPILFNKQLDINRTDVEGVLRNTDLRHIDQSWRLSRPEEVVLFGRVDPRAGEGPAEKITRDGISPSRLWLGELPSSGKSRPALVGTMTQRTYVRVYIPVSPQKQ
jgi:hypothetical protein